MILAFEFAKSNLDVFSVADVDEEEHVDNSLVEIRSWSLVEILDLTFRLRYCSLSLVKILRLNFAQDVDA